MPIYEYQCSKCSHKMEVIQKMSDNPLTECPECHQATLTKLVSASGFQLKGTGWYVTDYSAKGKAKTQEKTSDTDNKSDTKSADTNTKDSSPTDKSSTE
jgi:putative FmdB family regulatory protein